MIRDVILSIRADEAVHRSINHHFSDIPQFYEVSSEKIEIASNSFRIDDIKDEAKLIDQGSNSTETSDTSEDEHEGNNSTTHEKNKTN